MAGEKSLEECKSLEERKFENDKNQYLGDRYHKYLDSYSNRLFVYNASLVTLNLFILKEYLAELNTFLILIIALSIIFCGLSAVLLLQAYRYTMKYFYIDDENTRNKCDDTALRFECGSWYLFLCGISLTAFYLIISVILYLTELNSNKYVIINYY